MTEHDFKKRPIVYQMPGMDLVEVRKNNTYKRTPELDLQFDVYLPKNLQEGEQRPAVFLVHGDHWPDVLRDAKDWRCFETWGRLLAASGLIAVVFTHRSTDGLMDAELVSDDIQDCINHVRNCASEFKINKDRIAMWASSGGVPVAINAAFAESRPYLKCLTFYYGYMHLAPGAHYGDPEAPAELLSKFSALEMLKSGEFEWPPLLIVRAGQDKPLLNASISEFVTEATKRNTSLSFINHSEGHHAFDNLDQLEESKTIIQQTVLFLKQQLLQSVEEFV